MSDVPPQPTPEPDEEPSHPDDTPDPLGVPNDPGNPDPVFR